MVLPMCHVRAFKYADPEHGVVLRKGHTNPGGVFDGVFDMPLDVLVADRMYRVMDRLLAKGSGLTKQAAVEGFREMAGVRNLKGPVRVPPYYKLERPTLFQSNIGYMAINADTGHIWPFWTLNFGFNHRAMAFVPGNGLAVVRAADIARVGDHITTIA